MERNVRSVLKSRMFHILVDTLPVMLARAAVWNEAHALEECASRHTFKKKPKYTLSFAFESIWDAFYTSLPM